jgi:hypothetical protein
MNQGQVCGSSGTCLPNVWPWIQTLVPPKKEINELKIKEYHCIAWTSQFYIITGRKSKLLLCPQGPTWHSPAHLSTFFLSVHLMLLSWEPHFYLQICQACSFVKTSECSVGLEFSFPNDSVLLSPHQFHQITIL